MRPPENEQGRPEAPTRSGPHSSDTAASQQQASPTKLSVRRRRKPVTVRVTYLPPSGRRRLHWALGRCPVCGTPHLSRSRSLDDVTRVRRLPCGDWVVPVIARSLSPYERPGEAA